MSPPRCDFDAVFYRVFCVTLLATALAFTVILTDVFVDIDALLAGKAKVSQQEAKGNEVELDKISQNSKVESQPEQIEDDYNQIYDEDIYRSKRSLDSSTYQFHLKNPKMKQILTNRLNTLLEELDTDETTTIKGTERLSEEINKNENRIEVNHEFETAQFKADEDLLHLTLHNILLKGILGNLDLNEINSQVHSLIGSFFKGELSKGASDGIADKDTTAREHKSSELPPSLTKIEGKFFEELVKCKELQNQIADVTKPSVLKPKTATVKSKLKDLKNMKRLRLNVKNNGSTQSLGKKNTAKPIQIKTVIDITTADDEKGNEMTSSNESSVKGVIRLFYNGKSIKMSQNEQTTTLSTIHSQTVEPDILEEENGNVLLTESLITKALKEYVNKHKVIQMRSKKDSKSSEKQNKRLKRNIKVKVNKESKTITRSPKPHTKKEVSKPKPKNDDDELVVEIETHYDSKGIKGKKKKEIIKKIVEKIQQAIRSDLDTTNKKHKHGIPGKPGHIFKIRKRFQNPLTIEENKLMNKLIVPLDKFIDREMEPISKIVSLGESMPEFYDKIGEDWNKQHMGPGFLSSAKSINSGERGDVELDYNKVMKSNRIPQRLQQPLNGEIVDENGNFYFDVGDLKFVIKEIDGTGFSIGFNQYVGEAPDPDNMKLFNGIQQILKTYDNNEPNEITTELTNFEDPLSYEREHDVSRYKSHEVVKRDTGRISRADFDDHSNEYKSIFDQKYLPYDNYQEVIEDRKKKVTISVHRENMTINETFIPENSFEFNNLSLPFELHHPRRSVQQKGHNKELVIDDTIFEKKLNPSQIFILANLLTRKKRSLGVHKRIKTFTQKKIRPGMSTYINKHPLTTKVFYKNNKRNKRHIDKIRIIASDGMPDIQRSSDENVFLVASGENVLADRATRDEEMTEPEPVNDLEKPTEEKFEYIDPYSLYQQQKSPYASIFAGRSRHNLLMSKYPHILMKELARSKEDESDKEQPMVVDKYVPKFGDIFLDTTTSKFIPTFVDAPVGPVVQDLSDALISHPNYKLTVKIIPKNESDHHPGFKETHTSINKSINKNGVVFSSQMNISEISKVENYDKAMELHQTGNITKQTIVPSPALPLVKHLKEQQEKIKKLLKQHTIKIEEQLDHLKKEKQNIENIMVPGKPVGRDTEGIDVYIPLNPPQMLHLNKVEAGQLISSAIMKLHDIPQLNDVVNHTCQVTYMQEIETTTEDRTTISTTTTLTTPRPKKTTTTTTTTHYTPPTPTYHVPRIDPDRLRILRTIQRNENLTHAILSKIDKNTDILQTFLQKLSEKLDPDIKRETKHEEPKTEKIIDTTTHDSPVMGVVSHPKTHNINYPYPKEFNRQFIDPNFYRHMQMHMKNSISNSMQNIPNGTQNTPNVHNLQMPNGIQNIPNIQMHNMPNMPMLNLPNTEEAKNNTELPVPFIYGYPNQYPLPKPGNQPQSNVYHAHAHRLLNNQLKDGHRKEKPLAKHMTNKQIETMNQTRFFLDDLEPDAVGINYNTTAT